MREAKLESYFLDTVRKQLGGRLHKLAPTETGMPDRLVVLPGGWMELVELKTKDGTLSPRQKMWHYQAAQLGTVVVVLYGKEDVDAWAARHRERTARVLGSKEYRTFRALRTAGIPLTSAWQAMEDLVEPAPAEVPAPRQAGA